MAKGDFHRNYITEEESTVIAMLAKKMICPECDAPLEIVLVPKHVSFDFITTSRSLTWNCTNSNCDQSK